jgi:hypothetical protein
MKLKLIYDWQSIGQSDLVSGAHLEHMTKFLFSVRRLQVSLCGAPSLTRGRICNLLAQLLLVLARAVTLGSKSRRTQTIFYCLIWGSSNLEGQVPVFISPRNMVAFSSPLTICSATVEFTQLLSESESELHYNWQSVSQSVCLGVEPNLGLSTRDLFFLSYCPVFWGRPLWREVGSVICQSFVNIV